MFHLTVGQHWFLRDRRQGMPATRVMTMERLLMSSQNFASHQEVWFSRRRLPNAYSYTL